MAHAPCTLKLCGENLRAQEVPNMRNRVLCVFLLAFALIPRPSFADPVRVTGGVFALDIEGDMFTLNGTGFGVTTTQIGVYSTKEFPGRCDPLGSQLGFCGEAEGSLVDWSFHTTGGEQLLGRGDVVLDGTRASNVDLMGSMRFDVVPKPLSSGGTLDFDFVSPFSFEATIRGIQNGEELFARQFAGTGRVSVNYEGTLTPGIFSAADETVEYTFAAAPTPVPEPGTLVLLGSGLAAGVLRRRRRTALMSREG
jgi:hypothetical protein